jgi:putative component of membrane protein insertase Oxa1/YidC/SpoIIIJ protein YidD
MEISLLDSWARKLSTGAITEYQKYLSPHKGFSCAHRLLYGGESCSQYIKRVITEEGLSVALVKARPRFQACKQANLLLRSRRLSPLIGTGLSSIEPPETTDDQDDSIADEEDIPSRPSRKSSLSSQTSSCTQNLGDCSISYIDCADCPDLSFLDCSDVDCSFPDCGEFPDCSSLDCSGADCGSWDCGSCGN